MGEEHQGPEREQGDRLVDGNLHLPRWRSTRSFECSGYGFASATMWRGFAGEREWGGEELSSRGQFERGPLALYRWGELGLWRSSSEMIGWRWQCSGQRSALSAVSWSVLSVPARLGRNTSGFSRNSVGFRLGGVACELEGAR
jgi:hypothetical protein